jgi:hypothetical protein
MRVWDLNPGYLNRQSLLGEHREIHAVFSIIENEKRGYARHPETLRWMGRLPALAHRHDLVVSEMQLRGYQHHSPVTQTQELTWPERYVDPPGDQFALLQAKYVDREPGRIPLPRNAQQLWAHHKYSVLARDPEAYRRLGRMLAQPNSGPSLEVLAAELVAYLRERPPAGRLLNALQHLWGYVSDLVGEGQRGVPDGPAALISAVRDLSVKHQVVYLLESTALSDLHTWISAG